MAFDLLIADGVDLGSLPLEERKGGALVQIGERAEGWSARTACGAVLIVVFYRRA